MCTVHEPSASCVPPSSAQPDGRPAIVTVMGGLVCRTRGQSEIDQLTGDPCGRGRSQSIYRQEIVQLNR